MNRLKVEHRIIKLGGGLQLLPFQWQLSVLVFQAPFIELEKHLGHGARGMLQQKGLYLKRVAIYRVLFWLLLIILLIIVTPTKTY